MNEKLSKWQKRYARAKSAYEAELGLMDAREQIYRGENHIREIVKNQRVEKTPHVRNLAAEIIEAQVSSSIPYPKVTARRKQDEAKAQIIEDMLRNEIDRLPFETMNDQAERTVPIQGGVYYLIEWDATQSTHTTNGELALSVCHPKQVIPQDGVYTGVEDMDYIFVLLPETKEYIRARYGADVSDESESEPQAKQADGSSTSEDLVTLIVAYYRNREGGIGRYAWVGDIEVEDLEDYQARRLRRCAVCGEEEPAEVAVSAPVSEEEDGQTSAVRTSHRRVRDACPNCGAREWKSAPKEYEEVYTPKYRSDGSIAVPGAAIVRRAQRTGELDEDGLPIWTYEDEEVPTRVPYYKPDIYPLILQRNVSVFGRLLGDSDIDRIADQQNTTNRLEAKIVEKLLSSGSVVVLPPNATIEINDKDMRVVYLPNPEQAQFIQVLNLEGNISQDVAMLQQVYEEARQTIGITDSFQGRRDATATSGKAKEFAAAQTAGRLDSKRAMKDAAYAAIFEAMFKFKLAYATEPRAVVARDANGGVRYEEFNRWDFLERDDAGELYWNDRFLFSVDASATLASNREAMWQETRANFQSGAFGNPSDLTTLISFWAKMEKLHYPGAAETRADLEQRQQMEALRQTAQGF